MAKNCNISAYFIIIICLRWRLTHLKGFKTFEVKNILNPCCYKSTKKWFEIACNELTSTITTTATTTTTAAIIIITPKQQLQLQQQ